MSKPYILHMMTPAKNVSPFDVNMACDAGWDVVVPYTGIELDEITGLVQDAIFSRGPRGVRRTAIFIGGRDVNVAGDMLQLAREAMVPPFEVSVFADPSGAFTTAAGLVASVEQKLRNIHGSELAGQRIIVFGGSGPVGTAASVIAARAGADVCIVGHDGAEHAKQTSSSCKKRYGVTVAAADGSSDALKEKLLAEADVVFNTAKAGVQILSAKNMQAAAKLKVAGDLNAVPPLGIEGIELSDDGKPIPGLNGAVGIGALAVGNLKYQIQSSLLHDMAVAEKPLYLDFQEAFERARGYVAQA